MIRLLAAILALLSCAPAYAIPPADGASPGPVLRSGAWLLIDFQSRQIIAARNADERIEPASLTKLMTAYVAFDALRQKRVTLSQMVTVSERAWRSPGARMFLSAGESVPVEVLLQGLVVQSGNDAAVALAEGIAGSVEAYVETMNNEAARIGLKNSHFTNVTGYSNAQHYSTPADLAALSATIIREFPGYFPMFRMREYRHNNITQPNRNLLLGRDPYVDGMKTGWTQNAGFCMVATAQRDDRRLIAVVIDAGSENGRIMDAQKLLNYGFEAYDTVRLYARGETIHEFPVWKGGSDAISAGLADDYYVTLPHGWAERLKVRIESMQPLVAPIRVGDKVATLKLTFDGKPFAELAVVALESVGIANMFVRGWHSLRLLFR